MKKLGKKKIIGIGAAAVVVVIIAAIVIVMAMRVSGAEAQQIALQQTGGGEIVGQEVSSEGLWNEYKYTIVNGDLWYEIEIGGFGSVEEIESGTGNGYMY
ncbi:MAG TPA: hypothetical protein H9909_10350 [Candidatus Mediterraneibacter norfolkensis]|nr:hypothetical protein [Candidatus Mediterraneibacter norfolkensis]